jgi:hypothetical protein
MASWFRFWEWGGLGAKKRELKKSIKNEAHRSLNALGDLIDVDRELQEKLEELREEVQAHMRHVRAQKGITIGTRIVGAACTAVGAAAAPFTGGATVPLVVAGAMTMAGGKWLDLFVNWRDSIETQRFLNSLREVAEQHDEHARRLQQCINSFVQVLTECAENNIRLKPSLDVQRVVALAASFVVLTPAVQRYIQTFMSGVWSFNLTATQINLASMIGLGIFCLLEVAVSVLEIVSALAEISELAKRHPVEDQIDELVEQLKEEISQLKKRKEYNG